MDRIAVQSEHRHSKQKYAEHNTSTATCMNQPWHKQNLYISMKSTNVCSLFEIETRQTGLHFPNKDSDTLSECQVGNGIELEAVDLQFEPYRWRPCGITWDSSRTVVVLNLRRTSALMELVSGPIPVIA